MKAKEPTKIVLLSLGTGRAVGPPLTSIDAADAKNLRGLKWAPILAYDLAGSVGDIE